MYNQCYLLCFSMSLSTNLLLTPKLRPLVLTWCFFSPQIHIKLQIGSKILQIQWIRICVLQQAAYHPEVGEDVRNKALLYGIECTTGYIDLLEHVLLVSGRADSFNRMCLCVWLTLSVYSTQVLQKPTAEQKQHLATLSKKVAGSVTELIQTAEAMKGEHTLTKNWISFPSTCSYWILKG